MYTYKKYNKYGIKLLTFDALSQAGGIKHCFTTRRGGVSNGYCESLNFSKTRDFDDRNVNENARRLAESLDVDYNKLTVVPQIHGCEVKVIDEENCGAGFSKPRFEEGYDAMITDVAGIPLMTLHGDCVPVFLYDPVRRAIGMVHSGWRGTALKVALHAVKKMESEYGCVPENIIAAIGPAIGIDCFEVDMPVYDELLRSFPEMAENERLAVAGRIPSKKQVSLPGLVKQALLEGGLKKEKIIDCGICTCCEKNAEDYFSHRRTGGKTGIMAGVICLV
jgi:YfiH family protein